MTDEAIEVLEKEIDKRSAEFQDAWKRTPQINRARFNDRMGVIYQSCENIYLINQLSEETEKCRVALKKSRNRNVLIFFIVVILFAMFSKFEMLQTEFYRNMNEDSKMVSSFIFWFFSITTLFFIDFPYWSEFELKNNSLRVVNIFKNTDKKLSKRSVFYKHIMYDVDNVYDDKTAKENYKNYLVGMINILYDLNRSMDDEYPL